MRRILMLLTVCLLAASPLFGDEVDEGLSQQTSEGLKAHTREMIRAGVDSKEAVRMTRTMEENRFQVQNIIRAQEIVMGAVKEGIPAEPLMNKAYEGITKGVGAREIVGAMEKSRQRYSNAYRNARSISGDSPEARRTGNAIAEGMAAGLREKDAERIADRIKKRDQDRDRIHALARESFVTAREIARHRVSSEVAADAVCAALENGYQAQDMARLRTSFMKNARNGSPSQLADNYAAGIRNGASSGNLESAGRYGRGWSSGSSGGDGSGAGSGGAGGSAGAGGSGSSGGSGGSGGGSGGSGGGHGRGGR